MKHQWFNRIAVVITIFGLSACVQAQREDMAAARVATPEPPLVTEEEYKPLDLMVGMDPVALAIEDRERALDTLNDILLGEDSSRRFNDDELAALLEQAQSDEVTAADLRAALDGNDALSGIAGYSVLQFLHAYVTGERQPVRGKIRKYYFNDEQKGGYLEVDTEVDTVQGGSVVKTDKYFWAIAIRPDTYRVVDRVGPPSTDPFPNTVLFPPELLDETSDESIWGRNLDQKLFGQGTGVVVVGVKKNDVLLDPTTHPFYESTAASCVDLMFWGYPPRSELPQQRFYCMGRCSHPPVLNTGG